MLYGTSYSVYVRAVSLVLEEKGVGYELVEIDIFAPGGPPKDYLQLHPFGKVPAFSHHQLRLYETGAITRYVDEAFPGPPLQPSDPWRRARMNQAISIMDSYAYRNLVWGVYVEQVSGPALGQPTDQARLGAAIAKSETCLAALGALIGEAPFLAGDQLSLADLHAAPMLDCFRQAPDGSAALARHPRVAAWLARMQLRPSMLATVPRRRA